MHIAATRRSVMARLKNKLLELFCNSFSFFEITMTKVFKTTVEGQAMDITAAKAQRVVESLRSHFSSGEERKKPET